MPSDIRSFFGGKPQAAPVSKPVEKEDASKKRGRSRKVVDDDEDEEVTVTATKKATPKKKRNEPEPVQEETTADAYFGKGTKPKRGDTLKHTAALKTSAATTPKKASAAKTPTPQQTPNGRSTRAKKPTNYDETHDDDRHDQLDEDTKKPRASKTTARAKKDNDLDDTFEPDVDTEMKPSKPNVAASRSPLAKRKSAALHDDDDDDLEMEETKPAKKRATPQKKAPSNAKKDDVQGNGEVQAILDSIPTIRAPSPPPKNGDLSVPFQYGLNPNHFASSGALDSSELPQGNENCLAGLTFVFTGQLQRLGREQGQELVKRYGGRVTGAPSKKTNYVVLGDDAGPRKLAVIKQHNLAVINEDGLFELIKRLPANGGDSAAAEKQAEKRAKEEEAIRQAAAEMDREEKARQAAAKPPSKANNAAAPTGAAKEKAAIVEAPDTRLWTVRYAPQQLSQICGNKSQVEKLQRWLRNFPKNQRLGFKLPGPDGSGTYRAVMIHGPPGIGKTTSAHLVAKLEGYDMVESNASDTRSKKLVENGLKGVLSTTSLMGYFAAGAHDVEASKKKLVLIMDEVDGMSAGDRGGVGALAAVCKKTQIPMILICNDRKLPKMKPFDFVTYDLRFNRPTIDQIRSRISTIAFREGLKIPAPTLNALIEGASADIRQVVNMISTAKLDAANLSFEDGRDMSKAWEKHVVLKPWDMVAKILGGGLFSATSTTNLNGKQELYFNDHEFAPLMLQENYLGTKPARGNAYDRNPKQRNLANLELISRAADSISDGDLVDRMIHGSQQQWSLMPVHAMFSFVRPASFVHGSMAGHQTRFTSWLGKNSNQGKLTRFVKEIQGHMRLRVSADRHEVRQTYLPLLHDQLVRRLERQGKESVPDIIALMDHYFLTREDWDAILELGVGGADMEGVKIESQAKATFTRLYNQQSHPMPFMKSSQVVAPKRAPAKERPDLEEALEESDEGEAVDDAEAKGDDDEDADLTKDKYVKQPKKRKAAGTATAGKASGSKKRKAAGDDDDDDEDEEAVKPKKGRAKGKAKK